jgi:hypothetical protein
MLAFPEMLIPAAKKAGIKVPPAQESLVDMDAEEYPHFWVFCQVQLCRPMTSWTEHWDNAKVIAEIPLERLIKMTVNDFREAGVVGL